MTKRTVYARYPDKAALFLAAVERAVARYAVSVERLAALEEADLAASLTRIAQLRIANLVTPEGLRLQRILAAESYRFPEIFELFNAHAVQPMLAFLAGLFARRGAAGEVATADPERAAAAFMSLVVGGPARSFVAGATIAPAELEARIAFSVRLFLDGIRPR
jgi:AcrR family transcriptional regulator